MMVRAFEKDVNKRSVMTKMGCEHEGDVTKYRVFHPLSFSTPLPTTVARKR